jgi:hypothetical protein
MLPIGGDDAGDQVRDRHLRRQAQGQLRLVRCGKEPPRVVEAERQQRMGEGVVRRGAERTAQMLDGAAGIADAQLLLGELDVQPRRRHDRPSFK